MSKKGLFRISIILLTIFLFLCSCCGFFILLLVVISEANPTDNIVTETLEDEKSSNEIAVIDIKGTIVADSSGTSDDPDLVDMVLLKLKKAEKNSNVKAIILRLDTPGGTVYDSDKIAKEVKRIDQEKPIIAFIESSGTSGGYYISAPARKIIASETSITGSIGVIAQVIELDGLYDKLGVKVITITNSQGEVKSMEELDDPNSDDRAILQKVLDDNFNEFVKMVMEGRGMTEQEVLKIADGSIFTGNQAKDLGLIDDLGNFDKAVEIAKQEAEIDNANIVLYKTYIDPWNSMQLFMEQNINPLSSINNKLNKNPGNYVYYLPE